MIIFTLYLYISLNKVNKSGIDATFCNVKTIDEDNENNHHVHFPDFMEKIDLLKYADIENLTDEMVEMKNSMNELALENPFLELATGVSADCGELLDSQLRQASKGTPWNETYDAIYATIDIMLEDANNNTDNNE